MLFGLQILQTQEITVLSSFLLHEDMSLLVSPKILRAFQMSSTVLGTGVMEEVCPGYPRRSDHLVNNFKSGGWGVGSRYRVEGKHKIEQKK